MSNAIKSVAIAGVSNLVVLARERNADTYHVQASGTLGPFVLKALVDAKFQVTVLTRSAKPGAFDPSVNVVEVDFTSVKPLAAALENIDGLVSTVGATAIESQAGLIDAAIAAGVKHFIPSEYGNCTTNPKLETNPVYAPMFKIRKYLQEREAKLSWTVLASGAFLEFLFGGPMFLDYANRKASLLDGGSNRVSTTSLAKIGTAVAGIFRNSEATKDRVVFVSEAILTQNKLLQYAQELEPEQEWEVTKVKTSTVLKEGLDGLASGDFSHSTILKVLTGTALAGDTYGAAFDKTDNALLGIKVLTQQDVKHLVASKLE